LIGTVTGLGLIQLVAIDFFPQPGIIARAP
jgi:hypothetical protein